MLKWIRCLFKGHTPEFVENCIYGGPDEYGMHRAGSMWQCSSCGKRLLARRPISKGESMPRELTPDEIKSPMHDGGFTGSPAPCPPDRPREVRVPKPAPWPPAPPADDGLASPAAITAMFQWEAGHRRLHPHDQDIQPIDYRALLIAYMAKVIDSEGITHIDTFAPTVQLTEAQVEQLRLIAHEAGAWADRPPARP